MARRRVGFIQSFKLAGKTGMETSGTATDAGFWAMLTLGFWWWITGVPENSGNKKKPKR